MRNRVLLQTWNDCNQMCPQRLLMLHMLPKDEENPNLNRSATPARSLAIFPSIVARNFAIIARRKEHIVKDYCLQPQICLAQAFQAKSTLASGQSSISSSFTLPLKMVQ